MRLADGRWLNVREFGARDGYPVLYNHGGLLCGEDIAVAHAVAQRLGVRLIAPDRPGVGTSSVKPGRRVVDWRDDVAEILAGVGDFAALGWSLGGPYALALGDRARAVAVVGCAEPITPDDLTALNRTDRLLTWASLHRRGLARLMFRLMRDAATPSSAVTARMVGMEDRQALRELPDFARWLREGLRQPAGMVAEYVAYAQTWGFDLAEVTCPVFVWQGGHDTFVAPRSAAELVARLPNASLREIPEAGHFLAYRRWEQILTQLAPARR